MCRLPLWRQHTCLGTNRFSLVCGQGYITRDDQSSEGSAGSCRWRNIFAQVCPQIYSGTKFTVLSRCPILVTSTASGPAEDYGDVLRGSCRRTTYGTQLQSGRWSGHVHVKGIHQMFLPWVNSNSWVWLVPPPRACNPLRGKTEKNCFLYELQCLLCLYLFYFFHWYRRFSDG